MSERKDQELTIITKARDLVDETMSRTKKFDKRLRFTLSNRIDEKALDVLEAIVEANETNPAIETDPQRRAKLCMVRFDLQTSALTGCKMLLIFLDIARTHGQIDNRACEFWTKRVLDVKYSGLEKERRRAIQIETRKTERVGFICTGTGGCGPRTLATRTTSATSIRTAARTTTTRTTATSASCRFDGFTETE